MTEEFESKSAPTPSAEAAAREIDGWLGSEAAILGPWGLENREHRVAHLEAIIRKHLRTHEGWVMVPREPTEAMSQALVDEWHKAAGVRMVEIHDVWRAILAAAGVK